MHHWEEYYIYRDFADLVGQPIASGILFRGCSPYSYQQEERFLQLLAESQIGTRIDLRTESERNANPVSIPGLGTVEAEIDPYKMYGEFDGFWEKHGLIGRMYDFMAWQNSDAFQRTVTAVAETTGGVLIHCEGGRDRTGVFVAFLQLLVGATSDQVRNGFSVSTDGERCDILTKILDALGENPGQQLADGMMISYEQIRSLKGRLARPCTRTAELNGR
jgi:protein tyrosine/serine phosphatase